MSGCPAYLNPAVKKKTKNYCSPVKSVGKPSTVTGSHGWQSEEQAKSYLDVTQQFSPVLCFVDRKTKPRARLLWLTLGGEIGNDSQVRLVRL